MALLGMLVRRVALVVLRGRMTVVVGVWERALRWADNYLGTDASELMATFTMLFRTVIPDLCVPPLSLLLWVELGQLLTPTCRAKANLHPHTGSTTLRRRTLTSTSGLCPGCPVSSRASCRSNASYACGTSTLPMRRSRSRCTSMSASVGHRAGRTSRSRRSVQHTHLARTATARHLILPAILKKFKDELEDLEHSEILSFLRRLPNMDMDQVRRIGSLAVLAEEQSRLTRVLPP